MEITIHKKNYDDLIEQNKIRWKLYMQKSLNAIALFFSIGSLILLLQLLLLKKGENFWRFETSFGLSILLLSVYYYYHNIRNRMKYLSRTREFLKRYNNNIKGIELIITEMSVTYKTFESFSEMSWSYFSQYKFYKDYLILIIEDANLNAIMINRSDISDAEFTQLYEFVKIKLPEKQ